MPVVKCPRSSPKCSEEMDSITILFYLCIHSLTHSASIEQIHLPDTESLPHAGSVQGAGETKMKSGSRCPQGAVEEIEPDASKTGHKPSPAH